MFRRERVPVCSLVWDLYGKPEEPVVESRTLGFGMPRERGCSQCVYQRVNLRGLGWEQFMSSAPAALWPLVPLTRDGANETAIVRARDAIESTCTRCHAPEGAVDNRNIGRVLGILQREDRYGMTAAECPCLVPLDGPADDPKTPLPGAGGRPPSSSSKNFWSLEGSTPAKSLPRTERARASSFLSPFL